MQFNSKTISKAYIASFMLLISFLSKADTQAIHIPHIQGEITIDAKLIEPQWKKAKRILLDTVTRPYDNLPSPVRTEALLMEDGGTFYLAFIAEDPDPSQIRAYYKDRDKSWGDDLVGIKLDTYNDQRTAYRFMVNPLGVQIDGIESEVTKKESDAWDGIWESKGVINEKGYIVEMALPLRMLNFKESFDAQTWGVELVRFYPRDQRFRISNTRIERDNSCEICQMVSAKGFTDAKQGNNLTITPSLVIGRNEERDEDDNGKWQKENDIEPSLDIRWGVTPDILLNATLNPDFSTVETDNAQLNINNTFALFLAEKRPFFLDNADYFDSNYNLVYTRNINAPNYGAKLTGRQGDHSFGVFLTDDDSTNILIPGNRSSSIAELDESSTAAALRYRHNYNKDITLGWISTLRTADDYHNFVQGVDGRVRLSQYDVFKMQHLYSNTEYPEDLYQQFCDADNLDDCIKDNIEPCEVGNCDVNENLLRTQKSGDFSGSAFKAGYYHNDRNWNYNAEYQKQNAGFRGDLGFISRVDYERYKVAGERKWYSEPDQWWTEARVYSDWEIFHNDDGELIEEELDIVAQVFASLSSRIRVSYSHRDKVGSRIDKSDLAIDGNTTLFSESEWSVFGEIKPIAGLYLNTRIEVGDEIDYANNRLGEKTMFRPTLNWNVNEHLEFKIKHTYKALDADNDNVFIARLTDFRATYQFGVKSFIRISVIYNNTSRNANNYPLSDPDDITSNTNDVSSELLYAYKINPQTVFYTGYSEHRDSETDFSDLEQDQRKVFMKFSYAWLK